MAASKRPDTSAPDAVEDPCSPRLDPVDALSVGHSLRTLARRQKTPPGTAEIYMRVGNALVLAAHEKFNERTKRGGK